MTKPAEAFWDKTELPLKPGIVRVRLDADTQVEEALRRGELVYVRAPRKTGKSSLAALVADRLAKDNAPGRKRHVVHLKLWKVGKEGPTESFLRVLNLKQTEAFGAMVALASLPPDRAAALRLEAGEAPDWFWRAAALVSAATAIPVIVFVDEIEEVLGEHRPVGEAWLVALRQAHQEAGGRLGVCVLGLLPARMLVRSPERTPFNTALEVRLKNYDEKQVESMAAHLESRYEGQDFTHFIGLAVYRQTGGQPNMTQCLLGKLSKAFGADPAAITRYEDIIEDFVEDDGECAPSTSNTYMHVDGTFTKPGVWPASAALSLYGTMLEEAATAGRNVDPITLHDPWSDPHLMLEAVGLAQVETRGEQQFLVARSRIARRMFNQKWVLKRLTGLGGAPSDAPAEDSQALRLMEELARSELCNTEWALEHKVSVTAGSGRERTPGTLFEFELVREAPDERLTLQMFRGVGEFGRRLWLRQVRTLRHLSGRAEALPTIYRGGMLGGDEVAYIITQRPELTLADPGFLDYVATRRSWALEQFGALAEALGRMAEEGISHRNIWPGAIRMEAPQDNSPPPEMTLASFEFSVMLRSMVGGPDSTLASNRARLEMLRAAFLRQPPASRLFAPPELLDGLFGHHDRPIPATVTGDVFSLGMVVLGWFMPLPPPAAFEAVLRQDGPSAATYDTAAHQAYVSDLEGAIERAVAARHLPAGLARVLKGMIRWNGRERLLPAEVATELRTVSADLRTWSSGQRRPLLACYSYREMGNELRRQSALTTAPDTEADQRTVETILREELRDAVLFHAPRGIAPFVSDATEDQRAAEWVLMGPTWLFYCQRFERRAGGFGGLRVPTKHVLRLAYAWPRRRAWRSVPGKQVSVATFGVVELAEQRGSPALDPANDSKYLEWDALLGEARRMAPPPSFEVAQTAFTWVAEAQREALELQRFPVERTDQWDGQATYRLDTLPYEAWQDENVMRSQVAQADILRDSSARFEQLMQAAFDDSERGIRLRDRIDGAETYWSEAHLLEVAGGGVRVRGRSLPSRAWLELDDVRWARRPVEQQEKAIDDLANTPALFDQLLQPYVVVDDELFNEGDLAAAVEGLAGRAPEIVRKIITSSPLMALQGPPGTGKTTIIAAVAQGLLAMDETHRILVTSQSNAAVDNIALRMLNLGLADEDHVICVRVASDRAFQDDGVIDARVREMKPDVVAARIARRLRKACAEKLASEFDPKLRKAYERLAGAAADGGLELAERVRESAAVVFATTAGSRRVVTDGFLPVNSRFDMAIVDEASKAWPMEIVQPMLLATRSLLVGDHRQLPAFGSTDMYRLLDQCIASRGRREEFNVLANNRKAIKAWLSLFTTFFENGADKIVTGGKDQALPGWRANRDVAEQLTLQFRMRSDIAEMVSQAFYNGKLESHPSVDIRERPEWLQEFAEELGADRGVVWINTPAGARFTNASPGLNLDQAKLAARLLARANTLGADCEGREAVILSPYKTQRSAIRNELSGSHGASLIKSVHTADSFQGQEAELVILPLTRGPPVAGRATGSATERYGFLIQKERTNVMVSRARELLVIIGDFDFFADAMKVEKANNHGQPMDLTFWEKFCDQVRLNGRLIEADELQPHLALKQQHHG